MKITWVLVLFGASLNIAMGQKLLIDSLERSYSLDDHNVDALCESAEQQLFIDPYLAKITAEKTYKRSGQLNDLRNECRALRLLVEIALLTQNEKDAISYAETLDQIARQKQLPYAQASADFARGCIRYHLSDNSVAIDFFFKSLHNFNVAKAGYERCKVTNYIGLTYFSQRAIDKAQEYYQEALDCSTDLNNTMGISAGLNNLGTVYNMKSQNDLAKKQILKALDLNSKLGNDYWRAINFLNLGVVDMELGNTQAARTSLFDGYQLADKIGFNRVKALLCNAISEFYLNQNQLDSSEIFAQQCVSLSVTPNLMQQRITAYSMLEEIYLEKKDTNIAYQYSTLYHLNQDSFQSKNNLAKIYLTEMEYKLNLEREINAISSQRNKIAFLALILLILLLSSILYIGYQRYKRTFGQIKTDMIQAEEKVLRKNQELTAKALFIVQKNETMAQISKELDSVELSLEDSESQKKIRQISRFIQKNTNEEVWKDFEIHFQSVHPNFYFNLQKRFPNLTTNEKKMCAFLLMNLTSKEISNITGQKISSLEVARSRLRKKLGITDQHQNLSSFLSTI